MSSNSSNKNSRDGRYGSRIVRVSAEFDELLSERSKEEKRSKVEVSREIAELLCGSD